MALFSEFSDDQLDALSAAMDSAHGEGAFGGPTGLSLGRALADECKRRGRMVSLAYSGDCEPDEWYLAREEW